MSKYDRRIRGKDGVVTTVDVYDVLKAFDVTCPATAHAVKKLLAPGQRGHKNKLQDLAEAKASIDRAIQLQAPVVTEVTPKALAEYMTATPPNEWGGIADAPPCQYCGGDDHLSQYCPASAPASKG